MAADIQLRIPVMPQPIHHQDTILVTDDDPPTQLTAQTSHMTPSSPPVNASIPNSDNNLGIVTSTSNVGVLSPSGEGNRASDRLEANISNKPSTTRLSSTPPSSHRADKVKYGELIVLGYNGSLVNGDHGRKRSKFQLHRRGEANGVKPSQKHVVNDPKDSHILNNTSLHSVSYTLSRSHTVIVQYEKDSHTDMFQIGRSSESPIDCVVMDTVPGSQRVSGQHPVVQSTISRFSCRICVDRDPPYTARIYAAGFDSKKNIFLGEKASKWYSNNTDVDGLTTNGVLILHPRGGDFSTGVSQPGIWREVSVGGGIYNLRETRSVPCKNQSISSESNVLLDGTLIDLCGATLVWRSSQALKFAPTSSQLELCIERINASRPQCPVGLNTLVLPKRNTKIERSRQPFVYLACGHVHGEHAWGTVDTSNNRPCPMCLTEGPFVQVQVGVESSLYTDQEVLSHAFTPCAHMASQHTVRYWSSVVIPFGCQGFRAMCPFCATPLTGQGFVKLIFQDNTEF